MAIFSYPIVGAFYRPPAKAILDNISLGTPLSLLAEPTNVHDFNAIAVFINSSDVPDTEEMREALASYGKTIEEIHAEAAWHLGYIPREVAADLKAHGFPEEDILEAKFHISTGSRALVRFEWEPR